MNGKSRSRFEFVLVVVLAALAMNALFVFIAYTVKGDPAPATTDTPDDPEPAEVVGGFDVYSECVDGFRVFVTNYDDIYSAGGGIAAVEDPTCAEAPR